MWLLKNQRFPNLLISRPRHVKMFASRAFLWAVVAVSFLAPGVSSLFGYLDFKECQSKIYEIVRDGKTVNGIDNATLEAHVYRYHGEIARLKKPNSSADVLTLTYEGMALFALALRQDRQDANSVPQVVWHCAARAPDMPIVTGCSR